MGVGSTAFRRCRFLQKTPGNRRFLQKPTGNHRILQKPLCPIEFLPFITSLSHTIPLAGGGSLTTKFLDTNVEGCCLAVFADHRTQQTWSGHCLSSGFGPRRSSKRSIMFHTLRKRHRLGTKQLRQSPENAKGGAKKRDLTRRPPVENGFPTPLTSVRFAPPPIPFLFGSPLELPRISLS